MAEMKNVSNGFDVRGRALQDGELAAWLAEHSLGNRFGLAVAGTDQGYGAKAVALAIVAADGDGRYIDVDALTADDEAALASWLADPGPPKAVHDAKPAMHALAGRGWTLRGVTSDTALAAYLIRPQHQSLALNDLLIHHMRCALPAEAAEPQHLSPLRLQRPTVPALILGACAVLDLADVLDEELARIDSSSLLGRLELPVQRVLVDMETAGIAVDSTVLTRIRDVDEDTVGGLLSSIASDGRIHTTFRQTSGSLKSSDPNLHEIANDAGAGRQIREAFVAGEGYAELMTARFRQIELRVMAHLSGNAGLKEASSDHHAESKLSLVEDVRKLGYASTLLGRRRYLPELESSDRQVREAAERAALAMSVQGSATDIVKVAMVHVNQAIKDAGLKSRMVLQLDEGLMFEVAHGECDTLTAFVCERMTGAYPLDVPLEVSVGFGSNWGIAGTA
jgi:DNA polymerase I